jgi:hypothetical protein
VIIDDYIKNLNETKKKEVVKVLFEAKHNHGTDLRKNQEEFGGKYLRAKNHQKVIQILRDISFAGSIGAYINGTHQ